jgi:hypothetical protein
MFHNEHYANTEQQNLPGLLANLKLKDIVDKYWQSGFTTLQVSGTPPVWISLHPESVGYALF